MKMYVDLTVEGTPEEIAAFKHIDQALAQRNKRAHLAIEAKPEKKPTPRKVKSRRIIKAPRTNDMAEQIINLARARGGITAAHVVEYFEIPQKQAYNRLYALKAKGLLAHDGHMYHAIPVEATA